MTSRWPLVVALSATILVALLIAEVHGPVRVAVALWFVLTAPGMAIVPLLGDVTRTGAVPLVVAVSLVVSTAVTTAQLVVGELSWVASVVALVAICAVGCGLQLARAGALRPSRTDVNVYRWP